MKYVNVTRKRKIFNSHLANRSFGNFFHNDTDDLSSILVVPSFAEYFYGIVFHDFTPQFSEIVNKRTYIRNGCVLSTFFSNLEPIFIQFELLLRNM